ncbi:unnamed protein product [Prorocentrum cordatum]|uniref:Uncharacterized protein n=1 Tax=Prorocentrum cordatum TaxID=2364126 RepID=A0ABN9VKG0_9DINO|nr:unnamed protein product [Polarella glacialis]
MLRLGVDGDGNVNPSQFSTLMREQQRIAQENQQANIQLIMRMQADLQERQQKWQEQMLQTMQAAMLAHTSPPSVPAPAPAPLAQATAPVVVVSAAMQQREQYTMNIPGAVNKELEKRTFDFEKNVSTLMRTKAALEKARGDVAILTSNDNDNYPNGVRAFKTSSTATELDIELPEARSEDFVVRLLVPRGSSVWEAMRVVHRGMSRFFKESTVKAPETHEQSLRSNATKEEFAKMASTILDNVTKHHATELGLEAPLKKPIEPSIASAKIETLYSKMIDKVHRPEEKKKKDAQKEKEDRMRQGKEILKAQPEELFAEVVARKVDERLNQEGLISLDSDMGVPQAPGTIADVVNAVMEPRRSKKRWGPGGSSGEHEGWRQVHRQGRQERQGQGRPLALERQEQGQRQRQRQAKGSSRYRRWKAWAATQRSKHKDQRESRRRWQKGQWLESMMRGASFADWLSIAQYNAKASKVYIYDLRNGAVRPSDAVPWPVKWLLTNFHHKHVFCPGMLPNVANVRNDVVSFINTVHHRCCREGPDEEQTLPYRVRGWITPPCSATVPLGL